MKQWCEKKLGDLVKINSGNSPSGYSLSSEGHYPFVKVEDLNNCNKIQFSSREYCEDNKGAVPSGSVIFPKRGAAIMNNKVRIAGRPLLLDSNMMALTPKKSLIDNAFLYYLLLREKLSKIADTSTIPQINNKHILPYKVFIPPLLEQQIISSTINVWDRAIDLTECLITAKQERRKWLMQHILTGKRRLPSFSKPWRTIPLSKVFTNRVDTNYSNLPLVAITGENGVVRRDGLIRRDTSSEDKSRYLRICPGDIGYNTMRMWQGVCGFSKLEGIVSPAYTVVTPRDDVDGEFMALLLKTQPVVHLFHRHSQGMVNDTLNLKFPNFAKIRVTIPDRKEQQAIASVFRLIDRELALLKEQAASLEAQKKGLMQQLLTGKKRVTVEA